MSVAAMGFSSPESRISGQTSYIRGIDVLVRKETHIPVEPFDGQTIPGPSGEC